MNGFKNGRINPIKAQAVPPPPSGAFQAEATAQVRTRPLSEETHYAAAVESSLSDFGTDVTATDQKAPTELP